MVRTCPEMHEFPRFAHHSGNIIFLLINFRECRKFLKEIGYDKKLYSLVVHQANLSSKAKLDALVCSAQETKSVKKVFKKET